MKGANAVLWLSVVSLINLVPLIFSSDSMNKRKVDIYIFSDRLRWPENIAYDISEIVSIIIFIYVIYRLIREEEYKRYVACFLIASILSACGYFLFYSQYVSIFLVPVLVLMILFTYMFNNAERNNTR